MRIPAAIAALSLTVVCIASCGASRAEWDEAENAGRAFLFLLSAHDFEKSFDWWDASSPWGQPAKRTLFLSTYGQITERLPEMLDWHPEFTERFEAKTQTGTFKFRVRLHFNRVADARALKALAAQRDLKVPMIGDDMLLTMVRRDGAWKVATFREFRVMDVGYGGYAGNAVEANTAAESANGAAVPEGK